MKSILEEIQIGNASEIDAFVLQSEEYRKCLSDVCCSRANLEYDLTESQLRELKQYNESIVKMHSVAEIEAFRLGMIIGTNLNKEQHFILSDKLLTIPDKVY